MNDISWKEFMRNVSTKEKVGLTHTRIGNPKLTIFPGKYVISDDNCDLFLKLYNQRVFNENENEYLTEVQLKDGTGPLLIDLDFRFDPSVKSRQCTTDHIADICELYINAIAKFCDFNNDDSIICHIFQKPNVNTTNDKVTKDGVHLIFSIQMDHLLQQLIRKEVLVNINDVFEDLGLTNDYDSVLDEGISKGGTNWQLYGSRKPGYDRYELIKQIEYTYDEEERMFDYNSKSIKSLSTLKILKQTSARIPPKIKAVLNEKYIDDYNKFKPKSKKGGVTSSTSTEQDIFTKYGIEDIIPQITKVEDIEFMTQKAFKHFKKTDSANAHKYSETHDYTMCLPEKYYNNYSEWIRVGWALHNCNYKLFFTWMLFSSQWERFSIDEISDHFDKWNSFDVEGKLTERSIMYWAHHDNLDGWQKIHDSTLDHYIDESIKDASEWDVANVVYQFYKRQYRCASISRGIWYEFIGHKWVEIDDCGSLRNNISKHIARKYGDKAGELLAEVGEDTELVEKNKKKSNQMSKISTFLKKTTFKNNIIKECKEIFYQQDKDFTSLLDENRLLMGFKNGVFDFEQKKFRNGQADDYISLSTNIDFVHLDRTNPETQKKYCGNQ